MRVSNYFNGRAPDGTINTPSYTFGSDPDLGFYRVTTNTVGLSVGSAHRYQWSSSDYRLGSGIQATWASTVGASASADTGLARAAAAVVEITDGSTGAGALAFREDASAPSAIANKVILYAQDNGSGKTQLMALFPTGAAVQVAIEA